MKSNNCYHTNEGHSKSLAEDVAKSGLLDAKNEAQKSKCSKLSKSSIIFDKRVEKQTEKFASNANFEAIQVQVVSTEQLHHHNRFFYHMEKIWTYTKNYS